MAKQQQPTFDPIPKCNLGDLVAENDCNLQSRYVNNPHYELAESAESGKIYFIGKKGFGKSALLAMLRLSKPNDHIVDLGNHDIGLDLLALDAASQSLPDSAQGLLFRSLWKAALMVAIHDVRGLRWKKFSRTEPQKALDAVKAKVGPAALLSQASRHPSRGTAQPL